MTEYCSPNSVRCLNCTRVGGPMLCRHDEKPEGNVTNREDRLERALVTLIDAVRAGESVNGLIESVEREFREASPATGRKWPQCGCVIPTCDLCGNIASDGYCSNCKRDVPAQDLSNDPPCLLTE